MSDVVYRILNASGVQCNGSHGEPDEYAVYTNPFMVDRKIRQLNDPGYAPGAPQPKERPYSQDTGRIVWGNPL